MWSGDLTSKMLPCATSAAVVWKGPKQSLALFFLKFIDFSQGSTFKRFFCCARSDGWEVGRYCSNERCVHGSSSCGSSLMKQNNKIKAFLISLCSLSGRLLLIWQLAWALEIKRPLNFFFLPIPTHFCHSTWAPQWINDEFLIRAPQEERSYSQGQAVCPDSKNIYLCTWWPPFWPQIFQQVTSILWPWVIFLIL